jgi:hypothetical protein
VNEIVYVDKSTSQIIPCFANVDSIVSASTNLLIAQFVNQLKADKLPNLASFICKEKFLCSSLPAKVSFKLVSINSTLTGISM